MRQREQSAAPSPIEQDRLVLRLHDSPRHPRLIHLPGLHGDWTMLAPFRSVLAGNACLIETTYPRQPAWALDDYACTLENALLENGVTNGWLLGESFSSQVAWQFLARQQASEHPARFRVDGLILVGGFVRHPWPWAVMLAHTASRAVPMRLLRSLCRLYVAPARRRFCHNPEAVSELAEFVERRTNDCDRRAITSRYCLIAGNDPSPVAHRATLPVFHLSGAWDPIVPWWQVRPWLRRHCPGYRASRILHHAGHNVLLSAPEESAAQILAWVRHATP